MSESVSEVRIEPATKSDVPALLGLIRGFAEHVQLADHVEVTEERLCETLFGEQPQAEVLLATAGDSAIGYAVFFPTYYESIEKLEKSRIAVNARMIAPEEIADLRVRTFDGAKTWKYLD